MPPKLRTKSGAPPQRSSRRGTNAGKTTHSCLVCQENIIDSDETNAGQDAIMCEGLCKGWLHRTCCGLTKESFEALKHSDGPFKCYQCQLAAQGTKISSLEAVVVALQTELSQLKSTIGKTDNLPQAASLSSPSSQTRLPTYASITSNDTQPRQPKQPSRTARRPKFERKFNVVIYGIKECAQGTPMYVRTRNDQQAATKIVQDLCADISEQSIRDCSRLGRYNPEKQTCRPLVITLARSCDTTAILVNRRKLSEMPGISIKPVMSPQERQREKFVLQERRKLLQSGINKTDIRIRGDSLFVNGNKYGSATNTGFTQIPQAPIDSTDDDPQDVPTSQDNCSEHQTPPPPNPNLNN